MENTNYLTTKQAAEKLGVSVGRVQQLVAENRLPATKIGRDNFILESDLILAENRTVGRPPNRLKGDVSDYGNSRYKIEFHTGLQQFRGYNNAPKEYKPFCLIIDMSGDAPLYNWRWKPENNREKFEQDGLALVKEFIESEKSRGKE